MKLFHKQLILFLIFFMGMAGVGGYFYFVGLQEVFQEMALPSVRLLSDAVRQDLEPLFIRQGTGKGEVEVLVKPLQEHFLKNQERYESIDNFYLMSPEGQTLFALNQPAIVSDFTDLLNLEKEKAGQIQILALRKSDNYAAKWPVPEFELQAVLVVDSQYFVRDSMYDLTIKLYLAGFAGLLATFFIAMISSRLLKSPFKTVEKAMVNIDNRQYGFRINNRRHDEFNGLYKKVNTALIRLEQLDSVQRTAVQRKNSLTSELKTISRFMGIMAHEVRNPLHALVINVDVLRSKIKKTGAKKDLMKHVDIIEREIEHLNEVIDGFLNYVRPGVPQKEEIDLNEIVKEARQMVSAEADNGGIMIENRLAKSLRQVFIDKGQIQRALHNVLINALQASGSGGKILIRTGTKGKKVVVTISDTGSGISPEELKRIFDLYFTTKKKGSGIGLPVTKKIVESNGGQMKVESKLNRGTTVTFSFNSI